MASSPAAADDCARDVSRLVRTVIAHDLLGLGSPRLGLISRFLHKRLSSSSPSSSHLLSDVPAPTASYLRFLGGVSPPTVEREGESSPAQGHYTYREALDLLLPVSSLPGDPDSPYPYCPFLPSLDVYLSHEESKSPYLASSFSSASSDPYSPSSSSSSQNQFAIEHSRHRSLYLSSSSSSSPFSDSVLSSSTLSDKLSGGGNGWTCLLCGKRFKTQFYLDRHLSEKHVGSGAVTSSSPSSSPPSICPASLCPALGCDDSRLLASRGQVETKYGPGSWASARSARRETTTPPCDEALQASRQAKCGALLAACFGGLDGLLPPPGGGGEGGGLLLPALTSSVCGRLSCEARLHSLAGLSYTEEHDLKDDWDKAFEYRLGWSGWLLLCAIVAMYAAMAMTGAITRHRGGKDMKGSVEKRGPVNKLWRKTVGLLGLKDGLSKKSS